MSLRDEIREQLMGSGGPFEIVQEDVMGERMPVFKNRLRSLRELLERSRALGDTEYMVRGDWRIGYAQHLRYVASVARALSELYGVRPGDRVAILAANCPEWAIACWATLSLGGIVVAMNGWWTPDEIDYGLVDSEPKLLIGDARRIERLADLQVDVPVLEIESGFRALLDHDPEAPLPDLPIGEDDPAVILYTSGTTGRPKGALASHRGILGFIQCTMASGAEAAVLDARSREPASEDGAEDRAPPQRPGQQVMLATSPMFHLSGLYSMILLQLAVGGKLVIREQSRFDPADALRLIEKERVTIWAPLGGMGTRTAGFEGRHDYELSSVRSIGFGGAPTSPAVQNAMRELFPNAARSAGIGYGSSETVASVAGIRGAEYLRHPESTGRVAPTCQLEIRGEDGRPVPEGEEGEIHVRSAYSILEYWRKPEATAAAFKPGRWLATGDIGRFEDGLLYINSRARDMILRNAENIYPVEIEYRLDGHPDVAESAVIGVDHPEWGQEVQAIVVPAAGADVDTDALGRWCGETLAAYKLPTRWEIRAQPLPRNASGKVLKNVLRGDAESRFIEE